MHMTLARNIEILQLFSWCCLIDPVVVVGHAVVGCSVFYIHVLVMLSLVTVHGASVTIVIVVKK